MRPVIYFVFVFSSTLAAAQSLPEAPSASITVATAAAMKPALPSTPASPIRMGLIKPPKPTREPGVLDRRFFLANSIMLGGLLADNITTRQGLRNGCTETSPLAGPHPSLGRQVGISAAEGAGIVTLAYFFKKMTRSDEPGVGRNIWMIFPILDGAIHAVGAAANAGKKCQ